MAETICIVEGSNYERLLPLVYCRPVYDLRCGINTLHEKIQRAYPRAHFVLHCRKYLTDVVKQHHPGIPVNELDGESRLFIDGRVIADNGLSRKIPLKGEDAVFRSEGTVVAARLSGANLRALVRPLPDTFALSDLTGVARKDVEVEFIHYPWNLVSHNGDQIRADIKALTGKKKGRKLKGKVYKGAVLVNPRDIFIDAGAKIKPGAVLDAENGPIYIGKNVAVFPNATIEGPAFIGDSSLIKIGAKIYENTSIGEMCKVGGEVEASIIHSYSNKQHDGFLGHAYLAMWVNLGADTNNSDLKNNYGNVKVYVNGEMVDSGSMFVGLTMGDHSKSAINTMFNTGTVVGVSSNIFGSGFPPKFVPSFSWGGAESLTKYDLKQSLEVARRVMARRKIVMTEADEHLLRKVFDLTAAERSNERSAHK
jgi:UDP-N-acetylglucosamine diphosphorylase / glucose-1-phosphate thymidylyltransferase / UDP-N-acetylgalactosamine diphosphorylase / glucosamine-1-phosphate N-acetyltransferase / galactosamine-1-phosphate N-acetyltransferase